MAGKSDTGHTHTKSQITDFPTSLPANGGNADYAKKAASVIDYNDTSDTPRAIKIGFSGLGLDTNTLAYIAGYTNDGKIKDVNKSVVQSWIGLNGYLPLSGGTMTGKLNVKTAGIRIPTSQPDNVADGDIWIQ